MTLREAVKTRTEVERFDVLLAGLQLVGRCIRAQEK